jgi:hypothetical protein
MDIDMDEILAVLGADDWSSDGFGIDSILICPHGERVEQDGRCPNGCVSPLRAAGLI